jgi:hypothetical protein
MQHCLKLVWLIIFSTYSLLVISQSSKENQDLIMAFQAENSLQLEASRTLFEAVISNNLSSKEDQCKALRALAIQDWKFYENYDTAKQRLSLAHTIGDYVSETLLTLTRIETESHHYSQAIIAAKNAINASISDADKTYATYKYCQVILKQALFQINSDLPYDKNLLLTSIPILLKILSKNPTHVIASDVLLGTALLLNKGELALKGWLSYFRFSSSNNVYKYLKPSALSLERILTDWSKRDLYENEQIALIKALGESRFYNYAKALTKTFNLEKLTKQSDIQNIVSYANFIDDVKIITDEYYRKATVEKINSDAYLNALTTKSKTLYNQLKTDTTKDSFSFSNFRNLINQEFGAVLLVASTSASTITGLILGHIVNERLRTVEQYGHKADFSFTELDMMVSNGYPSWFWEDRGAGGFAIPDGFLRIKTMFKHLGITAWEKVTDSIKRSKIEKSIEDDLFSSTLATEGNRLLAATAKKLELDALDNLYKDLVNKGYNDLELQLKFIEHYDLFRDNATMFAHEGRHSLDRVVLGNSYRDLGAAKIEFRGRLSQIAFSESPKLEIADMINGISTTNNGKANQMIVDVFEKWIKTNKKSIIGFDTNNRPISQLYKLTNYQIKSCIQEADPFYTNYTKD